MNSLNTFALLTFASSTTRSSIGSMIVFPGIIWMSPSGYWQIHPRRIPPDCSSCLCPFQSSYLSYINLLVYVELSYAYSCFGFGFCVQPYWFRTYLWLSTRYQPRIFLYSRSAFSHFVQFSIVLLLHCRIGVSYHLPFFSCILFSVSISTGYHPSLIADGLIVRVGTHLFSISWVLLINLIQMPLLSRSPINILTQSHFLIPVLIVS